jgi:hypothetical protein
MTTVRSREKGLRPVGTGIAFGILSLTSLFFAVFAAFGEAGYYRTYGCFFSGFNIFDVCGHPASGVVFLILGELVLVGLAALFAWMAYRRLSRP